VEWLKKLDRRDLANFYKLIETVEQDTDGRVEAVSREINAIRRTQERIWLRNAQTGRTVRKASPRVNA
jgi:hypothetical protein